MSTSSFFNEKQAAAFLKHEILRCYLGIFVNKTGVKSTGNRVVYLDGYAGQGTYDDGQPGSPMLAAKTAESLAGVRHIKGIYVEKDTRNADLLDRALGNTTHEYVILRDALANCMEEALDLVHQDDPLFAFFDPFGLPISINLIAQVMKHSRMTSGRRIGPPTEILITFSYPGLQRNAGHLTSTTTGKKYLKARETTLRKLNNILGGDWWQSIWKDKTQGKAERIASEYANRLAKQMNARGLYQVPVSRRWNGPTLYELLFFTQYPAEGNWFFNECVSYAMDSFKTFCASGQLELESAETRGERWINIIKSNIQELLSSTSGFVIIDRMAEIYGTALGYARQKHLRAALKELHKKGIIKYNNGKDSLANVHVERN